MWYAQVCTNVSIFNNNARALARTLISRFRPLVELLLLFVRYVVANSVLRAKNKANVDQVIW